MAHRKLITHLYTILTQAILEWSLQIPRYDWFFITLIRLIPTTMGHTIQLLTSLSSSKMLVNPLDWMGGFKQEPY